MNRIHAPLLLVVSTLASAPLRADTINQTNGTSLDDVTVVSETYREVEYKADKGTKTVPAGQVMSIRYERKPRLVDQADSMIAEGAYEDALSDLDLYVSGYLESGKKERMAWAPAYAANRIVQVNFTLGKLPEVVKAADRLIENFSDSRYVPSAYLAKADALVLEGKKPAAEAALRELSALVQRESLSPRWRLEADLALVLLDDNLKGDSRRDRLVVISGEAGDQFPTVRNRADVAEGEALLEAKKFADAEKIFQRIVDDPKADDRTLAAAYTGLGDCLYARAAGKEDAEAKKVLRDALQSYMRVVVVFKDQSFYVPKAMFFAGRSFDLSGNEEWKERAQRMYREVKRQYSGSSWAKEASNFIK